MFPGSDTIVALRYLAGDLYSLIWKIIKFKQFFSINLIKHWSDIKSLDCYERHTTPVRDILLHFLLWRGGIFCRIGYSVSMNLVTIKLFAPRLIKTKDWNTQITSLTFLWLHLRKIICFQQQPVFIGLYICLCTYLHKKTPHNYTNWFI